LGTIIRRSTSQEYAEANLAEHLACRGFVAATGDTYVALANADRQHECGAIVLGLPTVLIGG